MYRSQQNQGPTGPAGGLLGVNSVTNPTNGNVNESFGSSLNVTYDLPGVGNTNPNFSDNNGFEINQTSIAGQNVYGAGTSAKKTFIPLNITHLCNAAGQKNGMNISMTSYGMGDSFCTTMRNDYAGGPINGDEGQCIRPNTYLIQKSVSPDYTISSIPSQSSANTTITQDVTASRTLQIVTVASITGISVNDWVIVGQEIPSGNINIEAVQVTAVAAGSITGIFTSNHLNGTTVTPALVLNLNSGGGLGEHRVLVNLSGASYSTGTIASFTNATLTGSGTAWSNSMVGGNTLNIGAISLANDDYVGLKSWFQIKQRNSNTSIDIHSFSVAGDTRYRGSGSGNYIIRPAARIVRINGSQIICETSTHTWTVGNTVELAVCPYPDVTMYQDVVQAWTPGGTYRDVHYITNRGVRKFRSAIYVDSQLAAGGDSSPWLSGVFITEADYGLNIVKANNAAINMSTNFINGVPDSSGSIFWSNGAAFISPDSTKRALACRLTLSGIVQGDLIATASDINADGLPSLHWSGTVSSVGYLKTGAYTVALANSVGANNAGAGALIWVSDLSGGAGPAMSDGTNWKKIVLGATIS